MLDLGQICILVMKMSYSYWFINIKKNVNSDFCGRRTFSSSTALPTICRLSTAARRPRAGVFAPRRLRIRNCNGRSFGGDVYLKQHAVSRHNVTRKMGGAGEREQRPSVPGDDKWGVGRWEGTSEPARERTRRHWIVQGSGALIRSPGLAGVFAPAAAGPMWMSSGRLEQSGRTLTLVLRLDGLWNTMRFYIRLSLIPSTQWRGIGFFLLCCCAGASENTHTWAILPDLLLFAIIVVRYFVILVTQIVLQVFTALYCTSLHFSCCDCFFWALWKEMFMSGRLCRCDDHTVAHFGPFLFSIFTFFHKAPEAERSSCACARSDESTNGLVVRSPVQSCDVNATRSTKPTRPLNKIWPSRRLPGVFYSLSLSSMSLFKAPVIQWKF